MSDHSRTAFGSLGRALVLGLAASAGVTARSSNTTLDGTTTPTPSLQTPTCTDVSLQTPNDTKVSVETDAVPAPVTGTRVDNFPFLGPDIPTIGDPSTFVGGQENKDKESSSPFGDALVEHKKKKKKPRERVGRYGWPRLMCWKGNRKVCNVIPETNVLAGRPRPEGPPMTTMYRDEAPPTTTVYLNEPPKVTTTVYLAAAAATGTNVVLEVEEPEETEGIVYLEDLQASPIELEEEAQETVYVEDPQAGRVEAEEETEEMEYLEDLHPRKAEPRRLEPRRIPTLESFLPKERCGTKFPAKPEEDLQPSRVEPRGIKPRRIPTGPALFCPEVWYNGMEPPMETEGTEDVQPSRLEPRRIPTGPASFYPKEWRDRAEDSEPELEATETPVETPVVETPVAETPVSSLRYARRAKRDVSLDSPKTNNTELIEFRAEDIEEGADLGEFPEGETPNPFDEALSMHRVTVWKNLKKDKYGRYTYFDEWTTVINVINATPFRWRRGFISAYQMPHWQDDWPQYIESGESFRIVSHRRGGTNFIDSAAEVVYHLEGTSKPMSFMLARKKGKKHHVTVTFLEKLKTPGQPLLGAEMDLEYHPYPGGSQFILSGVEGEFHTVEIEKNWMQRMLPMIGKFPLREIVMPRSHHVGVNRAANKIGVAEGRNTICQTKTAAEQIEKWGMRVLDVRPFLYNGVFRCGHGSMVLGAFNGMLGETVEDVAKAVGDFQRRRPGELIIIDLSEDSGQFISGKQPLFPEQRKELCDMFAKHCNLTSVPDGVDITRWPLEKLIGDKTSATFVRVGPNWSSEPEFPGPKAGFLPPFSFPYHHRWSDKNDRLDLARDQVEHLREKQRSRLGMVYWSDWLITQSDMQAAFPVDSITEMALPAYDALYKELWEALTDEVYPNWIAMDHVHLGQLTSFVIALNQCLVARRCGNLGGMVPGYGKETGRY